MAWRKPASEQEWLIIIPAQIVCNGTSLDLCRKGVGVGVGGREKGRQRFVYVFLYNGLYFSIPPVILVYYFFI